MTIALSDTEIVTPELRISFPALFEPKAVLGSVDKKFQAVLLLPPDTDQAPFKACLRAALINKFGEIPERLSNTSLRIKRCRGEAIADWIPEHLHDWYFINTRAGDAPNVVDQARDPVLDDKLAKVNPQEAMRRAVARIYSGCWCRFHLNAFAWDHPTGGKGVSFSLNSVQLIKDDERFDSRRSTEDVFDAIDVEDEDKAAEADVDELFG